MLCLLALTGLVLAADPVTELQRLTDQVGGTVLVGAAGPEAQSRLERRLRDSPALAAKLKLVRVPTAGDPNAEMRRVLDQEDLACGLRVALEGAAWSVSEHGDCLAGEQLDTPTSTSTQATVTGPAVAVHAELMAMPDHETRQVLLTAKLSTAGLDADLTSRLGQALAVIALLEERGVVDEERVSAYLAAALADDPDLRSAVVGAAAKGSAPPVVVVGSATPAAPPSSTPPPTADTGTLCVSRPYNFIGSAVGLNVIVDGRAQPPLKNNSAVVVELPAGEVWLEVGPQGAGGVKFLVDIVAGRTTAFEVRPSLGSLKVLPAGLTGKVAELCATVP